MPTKIGTRLTGITAPRALRSIAPTNTKVLILTNTSGFGLTVKNEDAGATAANRIVTGTGSDLTMAAGSSLYMVYDTTGLRYRIIGGSGSGGGGTDPMTTRGDMIYRDAANATERLPIGLRSQVVTSDGVDVSYQDVPSENFLANGNFEKGEVDWAESGEFSALSLNSSTQLDGTRSLTWTNNESGGTRGKVEGDLRVVDLGYRGLTAQCSAVLRVVGTGGPYKTYLTKGGVKVDATETQIDATGGGLPYPSAIGTFVFDGSDYKYVVEDISGTNGDVLTLDVVKASTQGAGRGMIDSNLRAKYILSSGGSYTANATVPFDTLASNYDSKGFSISSGVITIEELETYKITTNLNSNPKWPVSAEINAYIDKGSSTFLEVISGAKNIDASGLLGTGSYKLDAGNTIEVRVNKSTTGLTALEYYTWIVIEKTSTESVDVLSKGAAIQNSRIKATLASDTGWNDGTDLPIDTVAYAKGGMELTGSNEIKVPYDGDYKFNMRGTFASFGASGTDPNITIRVNGTAKAVLYPEPEGGPADRYTMVLPCTLEELKAGNLITIESNLGFKPNGSRPCVLYGY